MSRVRVSQKSGLSPSITKGSNAINLGKNSGVDMGRKAQLSVTSGGIGITQEVTNIAGVSVNAGANVDITPLNFGISVNPSEGTVSVATGAEIPGGLLGISGGIEINTNTGQITGGSIGGEALGLGINLSNSAKGGLGIEFTVQIPGTPIELSLGFGVPPKRKALSSPSPSPSPSPSLPPAPVTNFTCSNGGGIELIFHSVRADRTTLSLSEARQEQFELFVGTTRNPGARYNEQQMLDPQGSDLISADNILGKDKWKSRDAVPKYKSYQWLGQRGDNDPYAMFLTQGTWYVNGARSEQSSGIRFVFTFDQTIYYNPDYDEPRFWFIGTPYNHNVTTQGAGTPPKCPDGSNPIPILSPSPISSPSISPSPFPNPPPRTRNMDECCRESTRLLRAIHKRLGISKFPGKLPETIIQETPKEGEQPAEPSQVPIEDFVDLLNWQFERDDERWGQWQVEINIKDSDITKEGDQTKSIKLPNLAESIGEFQGQLLSIMTNVDALVAIQVKTLAESGMARQEAIKGYLAAKAIIKYMAFKSTEIDVSVPLTFTAGAESISELLKESEGHIKGTDYEEKETLRDIYADLLQGAAIIRAVHWQRIDTKSDTKSQLLNILKGSVDLAATITRPQNPNGENNESFNPEKDFEDFIDSVEDGFRNTTGITDGQNPYGKSPDRRPRIRQIGDNVAQAGGNS